MNFFMTRERPINNRKGIEAHERFFEAIEAAATGDRIFLPPADNTNNRLLRVLIVDDHRATTDTLSSLVTIWGHNVRRAYDGITGLALAAAFRPDVLLLDMLMPDLSGFEVARQMRRQERLKYCFIVAVTGRTDAKHRSQCYEAGVNLFLIKPFAPTNMQALLSLEAERISRLNETATRAESRREHSAAY